MKYQTFIVNKQYSNIYYFLKDSGFSENFISNLRKTWGNFVLNNEIVDIRQGLNVGDELKINSNPNTKTNIMQCILPLDIVYEDEYYLLINKPSGLPCMPSRSYYSYNLSGAVCNYMNNKEENFVLRIINRLDKDTAGIIIIAKDSISQNKIKEIEKEYHAVCKGQIIDSFVIDKPIKTICENSRNEHKRVISSDGKQAKTYISPINFNKDYSLITLRLEHGRTHQIRVHLSSCGFPLIGDYLYGEKTDLIDHTALICKKLSFFHPYLEKKLSFEIDYPNDFKELITKSNLSIKKD